MTATERKWVEQVRAWRASGLCAREFSIGRGFTGGGLRSWAHVLEKRGLMASRVSARRVRLARVERSAAVAAVGSTLTLEVGGARLSVPSGFDEATLGAVMRALREASEAGGA